MNSRLFIRTRTVITAGVLVAIGSPISRPIENPSIFNPANYSTIPPSSYQSYSISSPIAFDNNGNLVITGNVRRGMHFRDIVPYESTTSFRGDLGSSSLNSFLRDSAGTEDLGTSANRYSIQPYYLQSRTVATTRAGHSGVFGQADSRIKNRTLRGRFPMGTYVADTKTQTLPDRDTSAPDSGLRGIGTQDNTQTKPHTIAQSIRELQQLTRQAEANIPTKDQQLMIEMFRKYTQEIQDRKQEPEDRSQETVRTFEPEPAVPGLEYKPSAIEKYRDFEPIEINWGAERAQTAETEAGSTVRHPAKGKLESNLTLAEAYDQTNAMTAQYKSITTESDTDIQDQRDILDLDIVEQVKKQLEDLIKSIDQKEALETTGASVDTKTNIDLSSEALSHGENSLIPHKSVIEGLDELKGLSQADLSSKAKKIRGSHTNPNTFSLSRFNHHFQEAQDYLKSGKYYAAANSYALASIYKPDEPLCLAGRGHALLGAGEYISSALFLSRAIEAYPEYLKIKIDLAATLGGQHILDSRVADIREWLLRSGSGKLDFLLGYIYYRMGRLGPAQQAIDAAYAKMPQSAAVAAVKKAVDDAIAGQ